MVERCPENSENEVKDEVKNVASLEVAAASQAQSGSERRRDDNFYSAAEAVRMQSDEMDMRPYIYDSNSKQHILWDSGSQVCAWPPDPGDVPDPKKKLKAVNGTLLNCYGTKEIEIQINRKTLRFTALKADVTATIPRQCMQACDHRCSH